MELDFIHLGSERAVGYARFQSTKRGNDAHPTDRDDTTPRPVRATVLPQRLGAGAVADTPEAIMRERQQLSEEGMFIVVARINAQNGQLLGPPDVISRGFVDTQASNGIVDESMAVVTRTLERTAKKRVTERGELKKEIRKDLSSFLSQKTRKRPIVLPLVVEI